MVIPGLTYHLDGNEQTENGGNYRCNLLACQTAQPFCYGSNTHSNPNCVCIERACISVVTLARLQGSLVKVDHNGQTGHKEEGQYYNKLMCSLTSLAYLP